MRKKSPWGEQYFILFVDDFNRMCCIALLKHKDETFDKFKVFKVLVENELNLKIKFLRSGRGGEFILYYFSTFVNNMASRGNFL